MPHSRKTVVITGASSGIGRACVEQLSRAGWHVFATVRKTSDQEELRNLSGEISPVIMDVEDGASIVAAATQIESELDGRGLDALVNCAGIGMVRPLEYAQLDDIRRIFEINVF